VAENAHDPLDWTVSGTFSTAPYFARPPNAVRIGTSDSLKKATKTRGTQPVPREPWDVCTCEGGGRRGGEGGETFWLCEMGGYVGCSLDGACRRAMVDSKVAPSCFLVCMRRGRLADGGNTDRQRVGLKVPR